MKMSRSFLKIIPRLKSKFFISFLLLTRSLVLVASVSNNISVTSDKLTTSFEAGGLLFDFSGNVAVTAPQFSVTCTRARIFSESDLTRLTTDLSFQNLGNAIKRVSITGPAVFKQDERSCSADSVEITPATATIILTGNVTVKEKMGTLTGSEVHVNYLTKSIEIFSEPKTAPVNIEIPTDFTTDSKKVTDSSGPAREQKTIKTSPEISSPTVPSANHSLLLLKNIHYTQKPSSLLTSIKGN